MKSVLKQIIIWAVALCTIFFMFSLLFPAFKSNEQELTKVLAGYPPAFAAAFSLNLATIFSFNGFYSFILTYINLTVAIMALYFGLMIFSREKRTKTSDFLLAKPISRKRIYFEKLFAACSSIILIDILFAIFAYIVYSLSDHSGASFNVFALMTLGVIIVSFIFLSIGILIAHIMSKVKSPSGIAVGCGFIFFIIAMLQALIQEDFLKYLAPMKYFVGDNVLTNASLDPVYLTISACVIVGSIVFAYFYFKRKDIHSV